MTSGEYGVQPPGYRLPEATRLGAVVLQVSDVERSTAFYRDVLGLRQLRSNGEGVELGVDDATLVVLRPGATGTLQGRRLGLFHFAILLPDRAALGRALEHLVRNGINPGASDHLVSEALYLSDPDGLGIEIYRDRPREEWSVTGQQLNMATEPLDFDGVLAETRGVAWSGMPTGTTIGHVHLHVGDIEMAKAFYHEAVGFDLMVWNYPGALFMSAGGYHHHLGTNTWAGPHAAPAGPNEPKLLAWQILLPSSHEVAAAATHIAALEYAVTPEEPGGSIVRDPWGTVLQLTIA